MRPRSLAGEVGQRSCLEAQAVLARYHGELAALAQNLHHLGPFRGIGLCLGGGSVRDGQVSLLTGNVII